VKNTENGSREADPEAIEEITWIKAVFIDYSGQLQKAQIQEGTSASKVPDRKSGGNEHVRDSH
jgi:hypothetical protein